MQLENTMQSDNKQGTYTSIFHDVFQNRGPSIILFGDTEFKALPTAWLSMYRRRTWFTYICNTTFLIFAQTSYM